MKRNMITEEIRTELFKKQDLKYRDMQVRIIPTAPPHTIIGVRTPELRKYAKLLAKREDALPWCAGNRHRLRGG